MLTTKEAVKSYLKVEATVTADDVFFDARIAAFTAWAQKRTACSLVQTDGITRIYDGTHDTDGFGVLYLKDRPVRAIVTVHESIDQVFDASTLVPATDLVLDGETGRLIRKYGVPWFRAMQSIQVVFDAGFVAIPADLAEVAIRAVSARWLRRREEGISQRSMGDESHSNWTESEMRDADLEIVDAYTHRMFA
jgi:hypothetical protein